MFKITIEGETLEDLAGNIQRIALLYNREASYNADDTAREEMQAQRKPRKTKAEAPAPAPEDDGDLTGEDSLTAPAQPLPKGATQVVDGGTGKPAPVADAPIQMTMAEVRTASAKLVAKDNTKLKAILDKYGAENLSSVPQDKLGDYAADVMEALEA